MTYNTEMVRVDPLQAAAAAYAAERWDDSEWRQLGRETGTSDIIGGHPRLYRSLSFGDDDYPDAALAVLGQLLDEAVEADSGEAGRMDLVADAMPDLPEWIEAEAPARTKRLFKNYLASRDASEIPDSWQRKSPNSIGIYNQTPIPQETFEFAPSTWNTPQGWDAPQEGVIDAVNQFTPQVPKRSIFIVHGHDERARDSIRIFVHKVTNVVPTSLAEEPGRGQTIIEKFEKVGESSSYVIVLLTPDDVGQTSDSYVAGNEPNTRARQNVVLELGYFIGKVGRENIVVVDAGVERPSDLAGLSYVAYPGENWKDDLRTEIEAGFSTTGQ